eukprot:TRINITY_DN5045_c0_g2_i1.p1 TRINITY_DN5045_c0_g2~~TRINITY_DN5045_c0_g2_i1.p1  ORF type:complete len:151 (+),score=39.08 TRINITY_DN5045_c0_g2_i1:51-503(+)
MFNFALCGAGTKIRRFVDENGTEVQKGFWVESTDYGMGKVKAAGPVKVVVDFNNVDRQFDMEDLVAGKIRVVLADIDGVKLQEGQSLEANHVQHWGGGTVKEIKGITVHVEGQEGVSTLRQQEIQQCGVQVRKEKLRKGLLPGVNVWCCV